MASALLTRAVYGASSYRDWRIPQEGVTMTRLGPIGAAVMFLVLSACGSPGQSSRGAKGPNEPHPVVSQSGEGSISRCSDGNLAMSIEGPDGATSMQALGVRFESDASCRFDRGVTLRLLDAGSGRILRVEGNPATVRFSTELGKTSAIASWAWFNWCGTNASGFVVQVRAGSLRDSKKADVYPRCDVPDEPSKLRLVKATDA